MTSIDEQTADRERKSSSQLSIENPRIKDVSVTATANYKYTKVPFTHFVFEEKKSFIAFLVSVYMPAVERNSKPGSPGRKINAAMNRCICKERSNCELGCEQFNLFMLH